jgi:flagellar export protein FliJ
MAEPGQANIDGLMQIHRYRAILKATGQQLAAQEGQVAAEVERRRQLLTEADRQVRVLEKLAERQRGEYERLEQRKEVKQMDEAGGQAHARRQEASL